MSDITEFIDEHDLTVEDVIDALDIDPAQFGDVPDEPTDFYDGEPAPEDLADDFDAVGLLLDEKESLVEERDSLRADVREAQRPAFEEKAEELTEYTDRWGDKEMLLERFDAEDEEERWTVDDLDDKIELVEDIVDTDSSETTTVTDDGDGSTSEEPDIETTKQGRFDLRDRTKTVGK